MQPSFPTHQPLSATACNRELTEPKKENPITTSKGFSTAIRSGVSSFLTSLSPGYVPDHIRKNSPSITLVNDTALDGNNQNNKGSSMTRFVQGVGLASKVVSCWVPQIRIASDAVSTLCASITLAHDLGSNRIASCKTGARGMNDGEKKTANTGVRDENTDNPIKASNRPNTVSGAAVATMTLVAMDRLSGAAAAPSMGQKGSPENPIPVGDSETLGKIGRSPDYPMKAHYHQTKSFSHNNGVSVGDDASSFTGHYNGGGHTISGPKRCLFHKLGPGSQVRDLRVTHATINNPDRLSAVLACSMETNSAVRHVRIENANIENNRGTDPDTGIITGFQGKGSLIEETVVQNCSVTTSGSFAYGGIGAGITEGQIHHLNIAESRVNTSGKGACAGIVAGSMNGQIMQQVVVMDSQVATSGEGSFAGIGVGFVENGNIQHLTVLRSNIFTSSDNADAGIVSGIIHSGDISNITVVSSQITTHGTSGHAGIGAGWLGFPDKPGSSINSLVALDSHVVTEGNRAYAGIGAGYVDGKHDEVRGITAISCSVLASGDSSPAAGIGAGRNNGKVFNTRAVGCNVTGPVQAGIGAGFSVDDDVKGTQSLNSRVNGELRNIGHINLTGLCHNADDRFVGSDCQLVPQQTTPVTATVLMTDATTVPINDTVMTNATAAPVTATVLMTNATTVPINGTVMTNATAAPVTATVLMTNATTVPINDTVMANATATPVTETTATLNGTTVIFSGMPATLLPLTASGLSAGTVAGIALGVTAFVALAGIGGYCIYRYCSRDRAAVVPSVRLVNLLADE